MTSQEFLEDKEIFKNLKFLTFNTLLVLKHFYSFRELEKELGISAQVLWRYLSLRVVPEKDTAQKILNLVRQKKLIERALQRLKERIKEPWELYTNSGVFLLAALKALDILRYTRFEAVLAAPDPYSHACAAVISIYTKTKLCILTRYPIVSTSNVITTIYEVWPKVYDVVMLPKRCLEKDMTTLLVASIANKGIVDALLTLALKAKSKPIGFLAINGNYNEIKNLIYNKNADLQYIIILLEDNKSSTT